MADTYTDLHRARLNIKSLSSHYYNNNKLNYLIKNVSDVGLGFSEPHGEHLGSFNGDKVCLALVGNGLSQKGFPTARGTVEQHASRRRHPKLQELVRILDRVLRKARIDKLLFVWRFCVCMYGCEYECAFHLNELL